MFYPDSLQDELVLKSLILSTTAQQQIDLSPLCSFVSLGQGVSHFAYKFLSIYWLLDSRGPRFVFGQPMGGGSLNLPFIKDGNSCESESSLELRYYQRLA